MFETSLEEWLQFLRSQGREYQIPTPPECVDVWERAQREGMFHLGKLFILNAPLYAFTGATLNRHTGDVWIWHEPQAPRHTLQRLFRMLVHAQRLKQSDSYELPRTVEEDWAREAATWTQARELAVAWGYADSFTEAEVSAELETIERFGERHLEAMVLAGSQDPALAQAAYDALAHVGWEREWDAEALEAALWGYSENEADNIAAVLIDRQGLRRSWSMLGDERRSPAEGLDLPINGESASLLRSALSVLANERQPQPHKFVRHCWGSDEQRDLGFLHFPDRDDLRDMLRHAMRALLAYPEASAFARWTVFSTAAVEADAAESNDNTGRDSQGHTPTERVHARYARGEPRLYRLTVDYKLDDRRSQRPSSAELWVLVTPSRERDMVAEAAWQGFIRSWLKVTGVRQESLLDGFQELWGVLGYAGTTPEEN